MKKTSFYYGAISGIVMVIFFIIPSAIYGNDVDFNRGEIIDYASMVLCLISVFFGIKNFRNKKLGGVISFKQAFGLGSEISGISALIFGIYSYLLYKFWSPDLSAKIMDYYRNKIINSGQSQEIITRQLKQFEEQSAMYANPLAMAVIMLFTVFAIGICISLISAFILKKKIAAEVVAVKNSM